ncbi:MAG: aldo/keto reductase [Actinobacteria bacterium]|nr:aldo/keto reductase [Actinomycetota bacterium]MBO0788154.1 aldo/keto reductase [Actinomycetota bacterium]MBO0815999.1 aldo/keto reductase [Actinomycetota bacterium]
MRYRTFGPSGLRVSELFLGTMTFGGAWGWGASAGECRKMLDAYAEAGGNVIDTASAYTEGESERIVGQLLGADRDRFVVMTKYTITLDGSDPNASGNHRKSLVRSLEQSLTRLRTGYIDLLWVHIWDPLTPAEEMMRAIDDVVRAGKVLYAGISDAPAWVVSRANTLADWHGWTPFTGLQVPYSLARRDIERDLLPMAESLGLSVAAWSPLANGLLTGKFTRPGDPGPARIRHTGQDISQRELRIAREVDAVADELGATSSQVALAWTMTRHRWVHPLIGARNARQLAENLAAATLVLPEEALRRLDEASAIEPGFPTDTIESTRAFIYGPVHERVAHR